MTSIARSGARSAFAPLGDDFERVDVEPGIGFVEDREPGLQHRHLEDLVALLLAAGKPLVDGPLEQRVVHVQEPAPGAGELQELDGVELGLAPRLADFVERRPQEIEVGDAGDLDRVLEGEEDARGRPLLDRHRQQVAPVEDDAAGGDFVALPAGEDIGERALARAVRPHDRMDLAAREFERDAAQDLLAVDARVQAPDREHQPTLPSRLTLNSFWASTANSIGNSRSTSLQNPLTINDTACSGSRPRWRQ